MFENRPFGNLLKLTVRGASHAPCLEFSLEGFPRGMRVDAAALAAFMERRAPGRNELSTARKEPDRVTFVSGLAEGVTTGETVVGRIANTDCRPHDYGAARTVPRPGHADFGQWIEYGEIPSGGGANSGRLTAAICGAGALCRQWLAERGISVAAAVESVAGRRDGFEEAILAAKAAGDSVGGVVRCEVTGVPAGVGGALFAGLETELAGAVFGIPGVKGVEFGNGFAAANLRGSENNDEFVADERGVSTRTNRHGGILGGRTTGMPVVFRVGFKPTPTIFRPQSSVDLATMRPAVCEMKGRHDPCIVLRAVPVVEAVAAFAIADQLLMRAAVLPRICLTLTGSTLAEDLEQYRAQRYFCDLVELRADLLSADERARAAEFPSSVPVPAILTHRRRADGGAFDGAEEERVRFFETALLSARPFAYVDFEDDFRHAGLAALARARGTRVIRSLHRFDGPVADIAARCRALVGSSGEIAKVAFMPKEKADVERLFAETREFADVPHVVCAMGALGLPSRIRAARTHSLWTYASVGGLKELGHVSAQELVRDYRFRVPEE